jgi:predicted nucleic acid-binding protein
VEGLTDLQSGNLILLSRITQVEVAAAFSRRVKSGSLIHADADSALRLFEYDLANNYFVVEITRDLLDQAMRLTIKHPLRAYDIVQLASCLETNNEQVRQGLSPLTLVSADIELNDAARSEGLTVEDPNDFP